MRALPLTHGFPPPKWQLETDFELLKEPGVYILEKMRTILLMNVEYNMNNKWIGKELMYWAEHYNVIAPEQFGSRKGHEFITAALNKRLPFDILRAFHLPGILCSNDAKSCYDCIVHNVAMICMLRTEISYNSIKSMFLTLQKMKHKVATEYEVSKSSYAADSTMIPIQGTGQGNGAGPSGWAVISSPLFETLRSAGFATDFISCLSHTLVSLVGYGVVKNTDLLFTADCEGNLIPTAQEGLNLWESCLRATGGAINAEIFFGTE